MINKEINANLTIPPGINTERDGNRFARFAVKNKEEQQPMKKIPSASIFILFIMVLLMFQCSSNGDGRITAPGIVDGDIITLKAKVNGNIVQMDIEEGQTVKKDKIVIQIDSDKIQNQIKELDIRAREIHVNREKITNNLRFLKANINYLDKQVKRFKRLNEKKALPGEKFESMELKLLQTQTSRIELQKTLAELDLQEEKIANTREYLQLLLSDHSITSPVDGLVLETFVSQGETLFPGTTAADVLDLSSLFIEVFIEEREIASLKLNQPVDILVDGIDTPVKGFISFFGKKAEFSPKYIISETERKALLYQVKVRVKENNGILKIGMPVTVVLGARPEKI